MYSLLFYTYLFLYKKLQRLHGIIHEREATRLAVAETDQLIHMIRHELPECEKKSDQILPTLRNIQLIKALGRLTESLVS